ncbi:unnamed protein product, partial [marine sediment metagenome]
YVVQVAEVSTGMSLTPPVKRSLKKVLVLVLNELDLPTELLGRADVTASAQAIS